MSFCPLLNVIGKTRVCVIVHILSGIKQAVNSCLPLCLPANFNVWLSAFGVFICVHAAHWLLPLSSLCSCFIHNLGVELAMVVNMRSPLCARLLPLHDNELFHFHSLIRMSFGERLVVMNAMSVWSSSLCFRILEFNAIILGSWLAWNVSPRLVHFIASQTEIRGINNASSSFRLQITKAGLIHLRVACKCLLVSSDLL